MIKQNISGPMAILVIVFCIVFYILLFSKFQLVSEAPEIPLPYTPPDMPEEIQLLRQSLKPVGFMAVMPPLTEDMGKGVRVALVIPNSPADKAGLKAGDLIIKLNGVSLPRPGMVVYQIAKAKPNEAIKVIVVRDKKEQTLFVKGLQPPPEPKMGN